MADLRQRNHMVTLATILSRYAPDVDYAQIRPMRTKGLPEYELINHLEHEIPITMDCSESITLICRLSGLKDPNGLNYDGYGYTGTMLDHLPHFTDWGEVHKGTLIVFGGGTGEHVVMVTAPNGDNPEVYSHGSHSNHAIWDLNTERKYHEGQEIRLLAIADL